MDERNTGAFHLTGAGQSGGVSAPMSSIRAQLWTDAYMACLRQGNAASRIDYQAHYPAVKVGDLALKAFDERFPRQEGAV